MGGWRWEKAFVAQAVIAHMKHEETRVPRECSWRAATRMDRQILLTITRICMPHQV